MIGATDRRRRCAPPPSVAVRCVAVRRRRAPAWVLVAVASLLALSSSLFPPYFLPSLSSYSFLLPKQSLSPVSVLLTPSFSRLHPPSSLQSSCSLLPPTSNFPHIAEAELSRIFGGSGWQAANIQSYTSLYNPSRSKPAPSPFSSRPLSRKRFPRTALHHLSLPDFPF